MRAPLNWIQDFTDCDLPAEEIAKRLTMSGLEVEAIERIGVFSNEVVIAEILESRDHPQGRDIRIVELGLGGERKLTALTAAPNVPAGAKGLKVAAALGGALLIDPKADAFQLFTVEGREILGVNSEAVLCSEKELGLSDDHSGVYILEAEAPVGKRLHEHAKPSTRGGTGGIQADIVLDVAILPNYGRCLSILGIARELAALTRCSFQLSLPAEYLPLDPKAFPVEIADPDLCYRYSAYLLEGISVQQSPYWMQRRLALAGLNPINNVVDVTNYVMLELGQPMHAFDLERLPARNICVRRARPDEKLYTLDQKAEEPDEEVTPRSLDDSVLLITSGDKPVAVAGVIGGLESQIETTTRSVLLESANFDFIAVRKAMATLKVSTDAGIRFSREVDPALTVVAIQRAVRLFKEVAGAEPGGAISDCYPQPRQRREVTVTAAEIRRTLGMELEADEIASALNRLGFTTEVAGGESDEIRAEVPGFRPDVTIPADIAEEVIRVVGFDRLESRRLAEPLPRQRRNLAWELRQRLRDALVGCSLQEVITYSLTTPEAEARLHVSGEGVGGPYVHIVNPTSQERSAMRRTLLGGLLETVARNHRHRDRIALFEIGLVFHPEDSDGPLPRELLRLAIALSGPAIESSWIDSEPRPLGFFDLKGIVESLLGQLHVTEATFTETARAPFHPGIAAELRIGGEPAGILGQLHPAVRDAYDLGQRVVIAGEFDLERLFAVARFKYPFQPFSRYPSVHQDLALVVDDDMPAERVMDAIRATAGPLLTEAHLFDVYRGEQLGEGKKSLAFRLTYCAEDRSLSEGEVNALREEMLGPLEKAVGAKLR